MGERMRAVDAEPPLEGRPDAPAEAAPGRRSATLVALAALLALEGLAVLGYAAFLGVELAVDVPQSLASSLALIALLVVAGGLVLGLAWATWSRRPWIRGAAITWQILQIAASWVFLEGDLLPGVGWALLLSGLLGALLAIAPSTRRSLAPRD